MMRSLTTMSLHTISVYGTSAMWSERNLRGATGVIVLMLLMSCSHAEHAEKDTRTALGSLEGRVFLVTRGGDLKPARLANVYLLSSNLYSGAWGDSIEKAEMSAAQSCQSLWRDAHLFDDLPATAREFIVSQGQAGLKTYEKMLRDKVEDISSPERSRAFVAEADENGQFWFRDIPPGSYVITAFGQAGVNLAVWRNSVSLQPDRKVELKLSSVVTSCPIIL